MILRVPPYLRRKAFSIVELLAAMAVFIGLMLLLVTATNQTGDMWRRSSSKIEQFQQARRGFESMTRRISQATLNTYWDYHYPNGDRSKVPDSYMRQSELRFRSGQSSLLLKSVTDGVVRPTHAIFFQAPLGFVDDDLAAQVNPLTTQSHKPLNNLLNTWGYFVEVADDSNFIPPFMQGLLKPRTRSRLMEMMEPSETLKMDNPSQKRDANDNIVTADPNWDNPSYLDWFLTPLKRHNPVIASNTSVSADPVRMLAENVIALVILPRLTPQDEAARAAANPPKTGTLSPVYDYDSKRLSNVAAALNNPTMKATDPELNPKNQLPPVVTVAMVAVDETSARNLADKAPGDLTFGLNMGSLFQNSSVLEDNPLTPDEGDGDLSKLEKQLLDKKVSYRVFTSNVGIRGAKWSRWQDN